MENKIRQSREYWCNPDGRIQKAFDCIQHDLLLAKVDAYGFSRQALRLINSFLENRHQRAKKNGSFSTYRQVSLGVPQGSVIAPCSLTSTG